MIKLRREPDIRINGNYLHRWYVIPRNRFFNIYLHKFMSDDDNRGFHDHPWFSCSFKLSGVLFEQRLSKPPRFIKRFIPYFRSPWSAHRLSIKSPVVWTLFITGPYLRPWGFWIDRYLWVSHEKMNVIYDQLGKTEQKKAQLGEGVSPPSPGMADNPEI